MNKVVLSWIKIVILRTLREKNLTRLDVDTLIAAGNLGYCQALTRYDPNRGAKFKTFAEYRIKGAVLDEVRKMIGDERCKHRRPHKVEEYDFDQIADDGDTMQNIEGQIDLKNFFRNVPLAPRELEILQCRMIGMGLKEIADRFSFSETRASQLVAQIKKTSYEYFARQESIQFKLVERTCPVCKHVSCVSDRAKDFKCDHCDSDLVMRNGNPIVQASVEELKNEEEFNYV